MSGTARFEMPMLSVGQASKEAFHNEALQIADALLCLTVEEAPRPTPPTSPALGACYIVAAPATGEWAGKEQYIAAYSSGGWRLIPPSEGMTAYVKSLSLYAQYRLGAWEVGSLRGEKLLIEGVQVVGNRVGSIPAPAAGAIEDSEARAAIAQILNAMRSHGLIES